MCGRNFIKIVFVYFMFLAQGAATEMVNVSTRAEVLTGQKVMVVGFIAEGKVKKQFFIAAIGPTLNSFGVSDVLSDPKLILQVQETGKVIEECDNWKDCSTPGLVALYTASKGVSLADVEAAIVVDLEPGAYTVTIQGADSGTGIALGTVVDVAAEEQGPDITPGTWRDADGKLCFNVSADGSRLTSSGSMCIDGAAIDFNLDGSTFIGTPCVISARGFADIPIINGHFFWQNPVPIGVVENISGTFSSVITANGTATSRTLGAAQPGCISGWTANPEVLQTGIE